MHRALVCLPCLLFPVVAFSADGVDAGPAPGSVSGFEQLDSLWLHRDDPGVQEQLLQATEEGAKAHPNDFGYLWRASRIRLWAGDGESDNEKKKALGQATWDYGDRAAKANPGAVEGYYFAAAGIGSFSQAVGILNALGMGLESKFNERLDKAISIDPKFAHAGPLAVKGRYYFELPWPKRNLWKSADWLNRALTADPNALRAMVWLADTQVADGNPAAARETLARLDKASLPDDPAEERRCKALGKKIAQQMDKEH